LGSGAVPLRLRLRENGFAPIGWGICYGIVAVKCNERSGSLRAIRQRGSAS